MSHLHLFNPENDLSLAHGKAQYTAPPNALRLHNAGSTLPLWFCAENDIVIVDTKHSQWISQIKSQFEINGERDVMFRDKVDLNQVFEMNPNWTENVERESEEEQEQTAAPVEEAAGQAVSEAVPETQSAEAPVGNSVVGVEPSLTEG